jgi:succinoglycan biosynthesis protein ExoO
MDAERPVKVSVIIPTFNCREVIGSSIASALRQSVRDLEVVVVDDGSQDDSFALLSAFAGRDRRIVPVRLVQNMGPGAARNVALERARGEWIAVLDADDQYADATRLENLIEVATCHEAHAVCDNLLIKDVGISRIIGVTRFVSSTAATQFTPESFFALSIPLSNSVMGPPKPVFKKAFVQECGITYNPRYRVGEDFFFLADMLLSGAKVMVVPEAYYVYSAKDGLISGGRSPHSRSKGKKTLYVEACDELLAKYGSLVSSDAIKSLRKRKETFRAMATKDKLKEALQNKDLGESVMLFLNLIGKPAAWFYLRKYVGNWFYRKQLSWKLDLQD